MRILPLFLLSAFLVAGCARQAEDSTSDSHEPGTRTASISVPTIQCGSCVANITKALKATDGVASVDVDLKSKTASVQFVEAKVNLERLEQAIANAGYDANNTKRNPEAYEQLDECCKLPDDQL